MIDEDLDYCSLQIEHQEDNMRPIQSAIHKTQEDIKFADEEIARMRTERQRLGHMLKELQSKWGIEKRKLKDMTEHRRELKDLKKMLINQNKMIKE